MNDEKRENRSRKEKKKMKEEKRREEEREWRSSTNLLTSHKVLTVNYSILWRKHSTWTNDYFDHFDHFDHDRSFFYSEPHGVYRGSHLLGGRKKSD